MQFAHQSARHEIHLAYENKVVTLQTRLTVRTSKTIPGHFSEEEKAKLEKSGKNYLFHGADEELAAYLEDVRLGRRE